MNKAHRSEFLKEVKHKFPLIKENINQQEGLLSFEIDVFIKYIQTLINQNQSALASEAFILLNHFYLNGNRALHELIRNAVCEDLVFEDTISIERKWAYDLLSEPLKAERRKWLKFMGKIHV
jgi:hypothetical protein